MADVTNDEVIVSNMDSTERERRRNGENREETGNNERIHEQVLPKEDADQNSDNRPAKHFTAWQYAMERGESPFDYMNRYMEKLEPMDENDLQKLFKDREKMRMEWEEAREEGRTDEFWKKWAAGHSSQPRFDYSFGPPPEFIQKWMKLKLEGKSRHEILKEMFGDKFNDGFNMHDGIYNANLSERSDGSWRGRGRGKWSERDGRFGSGQDDGEWRFRDEGGWEGRGEGGWRGHGEGGWRGRGELGWRGRGEGGWRGRGWRGRGWNMLANSVDPDRSYLFQQFHI